MRKLTCLRTVLGVGCMLVGGLSLSAAMAACGGDDVQAPATPADATTDGTTEGGGGDGGAHEGGGDVVTPGDGGGDGGTLYTRLGGHTGIRAAVNAVVAAELMDPNISTYFVFQAMPTAGHPTADQLEECFTDLVGQAAGGPETYPTTVVDDAGTFTCRDMMTIHQPFMISGGTFDQFIMIAGTTLSGLGVSSADLMTLAGALLATRPQIVYAPLADAGVMPFDGSAD